VRGCRLAVALLGSLAALLFPAKGSALRAVAIVLTPTGPSPSVLTIPAGLYPVWQNGDTATHTVVFANGLCALQLSPGGIGNCANISQFAGQFAYTVDGTFQGSVNVVPDGRAVTLTARSHSITRGAVLKLHGELGVSILSPPVPPGPQPVVVLARPDRYHPFHRFRVVTATTHGWHLQWHLRVRPHARTIYMAEANSQPAGGQYWDNAWSKSFRVAVRSR
jgi:hypothetical protein